MLFGGRMGAAMAISIRPLAFGLFLYGRIVMLT